MLRVKKPRRSGYPVIIITLTAGLALGAFAMRIAESVDALSGYRPWEDVTDAVISSEIQSGTSWASWHHLGCVEEEATLELPDSVLTVTLCATHSNDTNAPLPIVLTQKQNGECVAYRPDNTGIIKYTTQHSRYLVKLSGIPAGVVCE